MKWVITGILVVSAAAVLANGVIFSNDNGEGPAPIVLPNEATGKPGYMTLSNDSGGSPTVSNQLNDDGEAPAALAQAPDPMAKQGYMTFSNGGGETPIDGTYTTPGGCSAPRPPEVEERRVQGVGALRFLESSYIHQVAAGIEAADGRCTCELRFPSWDAALDDLKKRFLPLPDDESSGWVRDYARVDRSRLGREIDKLCKAQGIY